MSVSASRWSLRRDRSFFDQARHHGSRWFTLYIAAHPTLALAVIVPKTVATRSTERHRLKRQIKNIVMNSQVRPQRLVISIKHPAVALSFAELQTVLTQELAKL